MKKTIVTLIAIAMCFSLSASDRIGGGLGTVLSWNNGKSSQEFAVMVDGVNYFADRSFFDIEYSVGVGYDLLLSYDMKSFIPAVKPAVLMEVKYDVNDLMYTETGVGAYASFKVGNEKLVEFGAKVDLDLGYKLLERVDLKVGFDMEIPFCRLANDTQIWFKGFAFSPTLGFAYNY